MAAVALTGGRLWGRASSNASVPGVAPLAEFGYADVSLASDPHEAQLRETHAVLMALSEDSLLKPLPPDVRNAGAGRGPGRLVQLRSRLRLPQKLRPGIRAGLHHLGNGCRRWRARMPSPETKRRARK